MSKPKHHPEDLLMAADFNKALYFTAHVRNGRAVRITERDFPTYEAARARADELEALHCTHHRKALVYAVCKGNYSILCTPEVLAAAAYLRQQEVA
jgi:hypothetical protein